MTITKEMLIKLGVRLVAWMSSGARFVYSISKDQLPTELWRRLRPSGVMIVHGEMYAFYPSDTDAWDDVVKAANEAYETGEWKPPGCRPTKPGFYFANRPQGKRMVVHIDTYGIIFGFDGWGCVRFDSPDKQLTDWSHEITDPGPAK